MRRLVRQPRSALVITLAVLLLAGVFAVNRIGDHFAKSTVVAYFDNSTGLYVGDDVRIRGVAVGKVARIEPQPLRSKVTFWFDRHYRVPADAKAVIVSPQLVSGRAIQLIPPYMGGAVLADGASIPQNRTAVPVEWDDVRTQLERLTDMLQPAQPGGVSTLGAVVNTAADNLRGQGATIRDAIVRLSQTMSTLGDHSKDIFGTVSSLSTLVSGLHDSSDLLGELNVNLAEVSALFADDPDKVGAAVEDLNSVVGDVRSFVAENREPIGVASDKLTSISNTLVGSLDDLKQVLHVTPTTMANFNNIYEPSNGSLTGALMVNNFANPLSFVCGAIQAASRLQADQASKLCVQYLAPIVKNRQYNFPPLGENFFVGTQARPNEVTYSEDRLRPPAVPPSVTQSNDPSAGLPGMMVPAGGGS